MTSRFLRVMPVMLLGFVASARGAAPATPAGSPPAFPLEAYAALGSNFAQNSRLAELGMTEAQFEAFLGGLRATFQGKPLAFNAQAQQLHEEIGRRLQALAAENGPPRLDPPTGPGGIEKYMKEVTKSFKLQRSDSGLAYGLMSRETGGLRPGPEDTVVISCNAVAADAKTELPSLSQQRQRRKVADLLPGISEGVQMMTKESSALLILPPDLAYGDGEWPAGVPRGMPLIFTVTLHEIIVAP